MQIFSDIPPQIIPRSSVSLLDFSTNDIYAFSEQHRIKLNPIKCKEMIVNFMTNHNFIINPMSIGAGNTIERVVVHKLLGVNISTDLKWTHHVGYILKRQIRGFTHSKFSSSEALHQFYYISISFCVRVCK